MPNGSCTNPVDFSDTTEPGFGLTAPDVNENAWQFEVSGNEHGRIHGYITGDGIFHVVWLDPKHELYA